MLHFLSESAIWQTTSEFITPDGNISYAEGESAVSVSETIITNESWVQIDDVIRRNNYKITPVSSTEFSYESLNLELGKQTGVFNINRNTVFSKFKVENTFLNGFEIIRKEDDVCYAKGALYDNDKLINTWNATLKKKQ